MAASTDADVIEIPGYKLLRQLGRGGMATVYLALQQSVDREVALKIMSPALLADPNFGERFLREAKIAAHLHHRHVVGVHDVGRAGDYHYIAMEYLAGGPILTTDSAPYPIGFALRVVREIAIALDYAHSKGFVHRDVKPDNILLRDDGSAALTDFGIARANGAATRMTRTGAVVGTPHYMSPEQARGKQIDGRADLYSLGIVLYELLVGRVPYRADDSLAVGIMHITQPVPELPEPLHRLQPILQKMLAREPEDRYQSGAEVAAAIWQIEHTIAGGKEPVFAAAPADIVHGGLGSDTLVSAPAVGPESASRLRAEPSVGRLDEIMATMSEDVPNTRPAPRARVARPRRWWPAVLGLLILAGSAAAMWTWQDRLRALLPRTELNDTLTRADQALAAGRLTGDQGDSARELFLVVKAQDPDNDRARAGLDAVGNKLVGRAREALARGDTVAARKLLDDARDLLGGGAAVEHLDRDIKRVESRDGATSDLLARAQSALGGGRILGADGAAALYQQILSADAGNALATAGLSRCADALATQVRAALRDRNASSAAKTIDDIAQILPSYSALADLRGELARLREAERAAIADLIARADAQLRAGHASGDGETALSLYQSALQREPGNNAAQAGLDKVAAALIVQANAAIEDSNPTSADKLLRQAAAIAPGLPELRGVELELRELRERLEIAAQRQPVSAADEARVRTLVAQADQAMAAGNLIIPPGDSAYDKFRAALALDGNNAAALSGMERLPARAKELFAQALRDGTPFRARSVFEAIGQLAPADPALPTLQRQLATAFLDQAQTSIAEGHRSDAARAVNAGRELNPADPRLATLESQLHALPGGNSP